jgi:hypothetical protein
VRRISLHPASVLLAVLALGILSSGCTAKSNYINGVYYYSLNPGDSTKLTYAYLQFYSNGLVSYVDLKVPYNDTDSAKTIYTEDASQFLSQNPPSPAIVGAYTISFSKIKLYFPAGSTLPSLTGSYSTGKITLTDTSNQTRVYLPLP